MTPAEWTALIAVLGAAGAFSYLRDIIKWIAARRKGSTPEGRQSANIATVDQSLSVVARARDELEADNALVRAVLAEERAAHASEKADLIRRHANERGEWHAEKSAMRAEIDGLQSRLRAMLDELEELKRRHP